mgnify:CR=1 FL=1
MHYFSSSIQETVNRLSLVNTPIPIRIHVDQHGDDYDMMYHNIICGGALYGFDRLFYTECQVAGIRLSSFCFHVSYFTTVLGSCDTGS